MSVKKKKKKSGIEYREIELNIMPFIDVFSMLNTFLLFSAAFLSFGIIEVQIPFLSNAEPPKREMTRDLEIKVDVSKTKVEVATSYTRPPADEKKEVFELNAQGLPKLHQYMITLKQKYKDKDKVSFFTDDDVTYEEVVKVLDAVKIRRENDPVIAPVDPNNPIDRSNAQFFVFPKVVMASVMLSDKG